MWPQFIQNDDLWTLKSYDSVLDQLSSSGFQQPSILPWFRSNAPARGDTVNNENFLFGKEKSLLQLHWSLAHLPGPVPDRSQTSGQNQVEESTFRSGAWEFEAPEELHLSWVHKCFIIVLLSSCPHDKQVRTSLLSHGDGSLQETHGSY